MDVDGPSTSGGSGFYMCSCRLRRNFFVRSVGEHFEYSGDDAALARQYEQFIRERGSNSADLPSVEAVLADVRGQREERRRAPEEARRRAETIAASYKRLHPEVYSLDRERFLDPTFLELASELRRCPDKPRAIENCIRELTERGVLRQLRRDLWTFPVFTTAFCDLLEAELAHFEASGLPKGRPNTMNRFGVVLRELGFCEELLDPLVADFVDPMSTRLLPAFTEELDSYRAFTVKYEAQEGGDKDLSLHYDNAEVTLNVNIGGDWTGGQVTFMGIARGMSSAEEPPLSVALRRGHGVLHAGRELHRAEAVESGSRQNLILWCRSSGVRNGECPMCWSPPSVVPTTAFAHDGFTVPPCSLARN